MRRALVTIFATALFVIAIAGQPTPARAQKRQQVQLPEGTVLDQATQPLVSLDGSVGFLAPAAGDTLIAFALRTGEVLGQLLGGTSGSRIDLHDDGATRQLIVTTDGDTESPGVRISVVDASDPKELRVVSAFTLAENLVLPRGARARFTRGNKFCVVPIVSPVPALIVFDARTGQQAGALTLDSLPDRLSIAETSTECRIAVTSVTSNKISIVTIDDDGVILPRATFDLPADAQLSAANNVAFDANGNIGYVASLAGHALLSFSTETGELIDRVATEGSSAHVSIYHQADSDVVAVVNISRPGQQDLTGIETTSLAPLGLPGAILYQAGLDGKLSERGRFYPESGDEIAPTNNADFSADGKHLFVPARTGALYVVDTATGLARHKELLDSHVQAIVSAPLAEAVAVVTAGGSHGRIDVLSSFEPRIDEPKSTVERPGDGAGQPDAPAERPAARKDKDREGREEAGGAELAIDRLAPGSVQSGRRRDLPVTIIGSGFGTGATVIVGDEVYSASVARNSRRINFTLSSSRIAVPGRIPVQVQNPDGSRSNVLELEVVSPYAPVISRISPDEVKSGSAGFDLKIRGDHFRDGAIVRATYQDESGQTAAIDLKTYRLSFTQITARFPYKLTRRARDVSLSIVDRDGVAVSQPVPFKVLGPIVTAVTPERFVAGDLSAGESVTLKITGSNFHSDVVVFVKRPARNGSSEPTYRQVPAGNVRWFDGGKIKVKLSGQDVLYTGSLALRVVNPVAGVKKRNGDATETMLTVAGPAIATVTPAVILAGSSKLSLKLEGTDFRRGAFVRIKRADGSGEVRRKLSVEDPKFKSRTQINVPFTTNDLLRMVAKPGTLVVRIVNPNSSEGVPSEEAEIPVVGPSVTEYEISPADDASFYRIQLTGTHFGDGAVIQLLDSAGNEVGNPIETKYKSDKSLTALLDRGKISRLRIFKIVVYNPGGPFNRNGVASNALDVTVQ